VDEEEYLLKSLTKLVDRFSTTRGSYLSLGVDSCGADNIFSRFTEEVRSLLPHLYQFDGEYRDEGLSLQADVTDFEKEMKETIEEVWTRSPDGADPSTATAEDTWASRMAEVERNKHINPLDKVSKPDVIRGEKWRINLYEF
jgi:elongator complex protein 1